LKIEYLHFRIFNGFPVASLLALLVGAGCIGTDLVDDPPPDPQAARIEVTPLATALLTGDTLSLRATYYDTTGEADPGVAFAWSSSDDAVASVDAAGLVTARQPGQAMVYAEGDGVVSSAAVLTVVADPAAVASIVVAPDTVRVERGAVQAVTATAYNLDGDALGGKVFTWSSSAPDVAAVDREGRAEALQPGTALIRAAAEGVESLPAVLYVGGQRRTGMFVKRPGTNYSLSGTATLQEQPGGALVLTLEDDFSVSNGPGLEVILSASSSVGSASISLGALQRTSGAQSYAVPAGVTLDTYRWVIIHCTPFNVSFGSAQLN
jgi:hypothetical protein